MRLPFGQHDSHGALRGWAGGARLLPGDGVGVSDDEQGAEEEGKGCGFPGRGLRPYESGSSGGFGSAFTRRFHVPLCYLLGFVDVFVLRFGGTVGSRLLPRRGFVGRRETSSPAL